MNKLPYFFMKMAIIAKKADKNDSDEETCEKLKAIANECVDDIIMEDDLPSRYPDSKLPILDMKVWLDDEGNARYTHYEKPTASKQIISVRSAHSGSCKRSVHVNELVRRMLNTSPSLSWAEYMAPVLEDYMRRMYTRSLNHDYKYDKKHKDSFMHLHQEKSHNNENENFKLSVTRFYGNDRLSCEIAEAVILRQRTGEILNMKSEFHNPPVVKVTRNVQRGL